MAQYQDLRIKGGADPDHQMSRNHAPPPLSIEVPKMSDLPNKCKPWSDVPLPVDILLLTVEDCEFLACYTFLRNSFKSYHQKLGFVYFGIMGESGEEALKVALMRCFTGSAGPGGSQNVIKNAVMQLRPKAAFSVGSCQGINPENTKLGDVVISSIRSLQFTSTVRRNISNRNLFSTEGWNPPLKDPVDEETVQVHRDSDIFSFGQYKFSNQRRVSQSRVIAVEREGDGLFVAAYDMNIEWVIVKGISHFSVDSNTPDESWKSFASIMAASVVSNMLIDPVVFKEWPHYPAALTAKNQPETTTKPKKQIPDSVCLEECQRQLRSLYETSSKVKIIPWNQNSAVDIDEIYTDLSWVEDDRTPVGVTQVKLNHYTEIFGTRGPRRAPKRILVYGHPGIGKTVFTTKATFDWSQQRYSETLGVFDLVLRVTLRDVSNLQDVPSILRASEVLDSNGTISVHGLYDYVYRHQEKVLLILDGYDEYVYSSKNESPVFKIWKKSSLRDCCVVITSREMKAETLRNYSDVQFKIDGFNRQRQEEFARRFLKDDKDIEDFFMYLRQHNLSGLAQIPLLLLTLCLLWSKTKREELPKERADIFAQFMTTMFDHMCEKQSAESVSAKDYSYELYALGRLAFEALLQGQLYFPVSQLPAGYSLIERLIEVGLFQVLNMASLNREKGVYFIHKSVQEYLAGNFLKEELASRKAESANSLLKLDSVKKISELREVLEFACELSEEAASEILIHLKMVTKEETSLVSISNLIEKLKKKTIKDDEDITKDKRDNIEDLIPAFVRARGDKALAAYHRVLETGGSTYDKRVKVLLVGQDHVGKTSLSKALRGEPFDEAEVSTDEVQMIPAVRNAGKGAWRNPVSLEHVTVFDYKVATKTAEDLLSTHVGQLAKTEPTKPSIRSESEKFHQKPRRVVSNTTVHLSVEDDEMKKTMIKDAEDSTREKLGDNEEGQGFHYHRKPFHVPQEEKMPENVAMILEKYLEKNAVDQNETIWPIIWDFAGQGIHRAVHPIFMSSEDIFLIVVDLTKKLGKKALCGENADHKEHNVTAREDEDTNLDHLVKWMDLIQSLQRADQKESLLHPPVLLVGTHADCVDDPSKEMKLVEERYLSLFGESSYLPHIAACLPIDNTKAGKSADQEEIIELRKKILQLGDKMPHTKKKIPLQWYQVENEISQPIWQRQKYLLKKSFEEEIVSRYCTFTNVDEFNELLHFLHCRGTVVYHEHEHAGGKAALIILDPQWLINVVFEIVNVKSQKHEPWRIKRDRKKLAEEGILSRRLIDHSCAHKRLEPIEDYLISLMDKFNIICKWPEKPGETETEESRFLVPCMLTTFSAEKVTDEVDYPAPLYLTFKTKCVPSGLFCRLLVLFGGNLQYAKLYANEAKFSLDDENHVLQLMCYRTVVKLHISGGDDETPPQKHYDYVLSHLKTFLEKLRKECHCLLSMSETLCARCTVCTGKETTPCARHDERSCRHPDCGHYIPLDGRILCFKISDLVKPWIKAGDNLSKERIVPPLPSLPPQEEEGNLELEDETLSPYEGDQGKEEKGNLMPEEGGPSFQLQDNDAEEEDEGHLKLKDERPSPYEGDEEKDEHQEASESSSLGTEASSGSQDGSSSDDSDSLDGSSFTTSVNGPHVTGEPREDSSRTKIYEATVTSEGIHLDIIEGAAYLMFPPNALSQPTSVVIHNWKRSARSPRLEENEAIVSNVIEISTSTGQPLEFNVAVKLFLCHSAPDLRGYEVVIKKQIDKRNDWEDVKGTKDLRNEPDIEDEYSSNLDFSTFHFPVAQADITEFSTYTVVCRLKSSPSHTITCYGCSIDHPDYPDVKVTIPENAVESETELSVKLKVQEVQNEEFERHDVFIGPILRIICSQKVTFSKPVTIQLPISLRHEQQEIPDISECRVRVLCQKSAGDHGDWREITSDLRNPASFDGKFVRFQVEHFCKFAVTVGRHRSQDSAFNPYKNDSIVRIMAFFFAHLRPNSHDILILMCCPHHLQRRLEKKLEKKEVTFSSVSSTKRMKPQDKVYFLVSGGMCSDKEDMHLFLRFDEESESKLESRCHYVSADRAAIKFLSEPPVKNGTLLGKLFLEKSTPVVNSYTGGTGKKRKKKKRKNPNGKRMSEVEASQENHKTRKRKKQKAQEPTEEHPRKRKKTQLDNVQGNAEDVEIPSGKKKKKKKKRKNHNGKSMSEEETPREIKKRKNRTSPEKDEEPPPDKQERKKDKRQKTKEIKDGEVVGDDLEGLSTELGKSWKALAKRLEFGEGKIQGFDYDNKDLREKSYSMLCAWQNRDGSSATYEVLYQALCHEHVGFMKLAEKYCVCKSTDKEECTSEG